MFHFLLDTKIIDSLIRRNYSYIVIIKTNIDLQHEDIVILCRDAAALTQFWVWIEEQINKNVKLTEVEVAEKLLEFRSTQPGFLDTSFDTISGMYTYFIFSFTK